MAAGHVRDDNHADVDAYGIDHPHPDRHADPDRVGDADGDSDEWGGSVGPLRRGGPFTTVCR